MSIQLMTTLLEGIDKSPMMDDVNKCIQIRKWRKDFVKDMNVAIDLAENYRKEVDKDKVIQIPSKEEIELKEFLKQGLDLIDSYLNHYRLSKGDTHNGNNTSI